MGTGATSRRERSRCAGLRWPAAAGARGVRLLIRGRPELRATRSAPLRSHQRAARHHRRDLRGGRGRRHPCSTSPGYFIFAGLWLAEEMYETGVLALILRASLREDTGPGVVETTYETGGAR